MDSQPANNNVPLPSGRNSTTKSSKSPKNKTQYCHWKFGTINVLTASDDFLLSECLRQCTRANLDICCFQEFRRLGKDTLSLPVTIDDKTTTWEVFWSGYKRKRQAGVAIAIRSSKRVKIEEIGQISPRLIWIDCVVNGIKMRIVSAYAPTEDSSDPRKKDSHKSNKESFYKILRDNCVVERKRQLIIGADMNATGDFGKSFVGGKSCQIGEVNDNGNRLYEFLNQKELALSNTWFQHKKIHRDTWYSNTGKFSKTIDYVLLSKWLMQFCSDCRVRTSFSFNNSDHRLLICRMRTPRRKVDRPRFVKKKKSYKYNTNALKDQYIRSNFVSKLDELCAAIETTSFSVKDCAQLVNTIEEAAKQTIPNALKSVESYIWDQDQILLDLNKSRDRLDRQQKPTKYKELSKRIGKRFNQLRSEYYKGLANSISEAQEAKNLEKMFRLSKKKMISGKPKELICDGLNEYFEKHFTHLPPSDEPPNEITLVPEFIKRLQSTGITLENEVFESFKLPPTQDELVSVINKMKNKKATTDIPSEFLKSITNSPNCMSLIEMMYKDVWQNIILADEWRNQIITPLYKNKGSRKDPSKYRGISIGSNFLKLAMAICLERIKVWYNKQILLNQTGFRQNFGCPDAIFSLNSLHHNAVRTKKEIYLLFIDLTAAYDWCVRTWLFQSIHNRLNPDDTPTYNCIRIMEALYKKTYAALKSDEEPQYFEMTSGVRQGGPESPTLFNLYLDYIMRIYNNKVKELGLVVEYNFRIKDQARSRGDTYRGKGEFPWIGYADDLTLIAASEEDLQQSANILSDLLSRFGLVLSLDKTESMILNYQGDDYPDTIISINNTQIKNVTHFKYLGSTKAYNEVGTCEKELKNRIGMAHGKFSEIKSLLCNYHLALRIRIRFYEVYVRSRLCYCCETWTLTQQQLQRIEATHMQFLRRMVRGGMERLTSKKRIKELKNEGNEDLINWHWKHTNEKIYHLTKTLSMHDLIERQNCRWISHVVRAPNDAITKMLMFTEENFSLIGRRTRTVYENVIANQQEKHGKSEDTFLRESFRKLNF